MENFVPLTLCCIVLFLLNQGACLKCRSRNQQVDVQFQKALKTCKQRYTDLNTDNEDSMSSDDSSSDSDSNSEEDPYDKNFFYKKNDRSAYNQSTNNQRYRSSDRNSGMNNYSSDHSTNSNSRDFQNMKQTGRNNDRDSWSSRDSRTGKSDFNKEDSHYSNNTGRGQICIVQCFFNELNVVDQKGFPERDLVIPLMSQHIHDPDLKDFVEESIIECFHYLESNKRDKCEFSQNLLKCLAEKGQEKCDDWEN